MQDDRPDRGGGLGRFITPNRVDFAFGVLGALTQAGAMVAIWYVVNHRLGPAHLGLWALISGTIGVAQVSDMGLGQAMVRYAQASTSGRSPAEAFGRYHTGLFSAFALAAIALCAAYFPVLSLLRAVTTAELLPVLDRIFPLMALAMGLTVLNRVVQGTFTGLNGLWIYQGLLALANLGYVTICFVWIDRIGLEAVAIGQVLMWAALLAVGHGLAVMRLARITGVSLLSGVIPRFASLTRLRGMLRLSLGLQGLTFLQLALEAAPRLALSVSGDLSLVGLYHMGERLAFLTREILSRPFTFLSGRFSAIHETRADPAPTMARFAPRLGAMALIYLAALCTGAVFVADLWVGARHLIFFLAAGAFGLSSALLLIGVGPYTYCLGSGRVGPLLRGEGVRAVLLTIGLLGVIATAAPLATPFVAALALGVGTLWVTAAGLRAMALRPGVYLGRSLWRGAVALVVYGVTAIVVDVTALSDLWPPVRAGVLVLMGAGFAVGIAFVFGLAPVRGGRSSG